MKNILMILSDEQRYDTLGCNGNSVAKTPNIDALAHEGVNFSSCFTPYPLCCPARASLWTGLMTHNHHVFDNWVAIRPELRDAGLVDNFHKAGYYTTYTGKWHVPGTNPERLHFDSWSAIPAILNGRDRGRYIEDYRNYAESQGYKLVAGNMENVTELDLQNLTQPGKAPCATAEIVIDHFLETWQTNQFIGELEKCPEDQPFFAVCSYNAPHFPMLVPEPYDKLISPSDLILSPNFRAGREGKPKEIYDSKYFTNNEHLNEYEWKRLIAHYWGLCSLVDDQVGKIIKYLKATGKIDNTIIVYTSDHGDMIGSHGLNKKGFYMHYDEVTKVPLIIVDPDSRKDQKIDRLVSLIDIVPSLAELVGISINTNTIDSKIHGKSFCSLMNDPCAPKIRDFILAETFKFAQKELGNGFEGGHGEYIHPDSFNPDKNAYNISIRTENEKYIMHWRDKDEYYDLKKDPFENQNLYQEVIGTDTLLTLRNKMLNELIQTDSPLTDIVRKKIENKKSEEKNIKEE